VELPSPPGIREPKLPADNEQKANAAKCQSKCCGEYGNADGETEGETQENNQQLMAAPGKNPENSPQFNVSSVDLPKKIVHLSRQPMRLAIHGERYIKVRAGIISCHDRFAS
jgi:hypothetical protein